MNETIGWPSGAGGWKRSGDAVFYKGRAVFDYMDGAGEVYLAYNFKQLAVQRFERDGNPAIIAEFYEMGTPQDAFGVFTWDRQDPDAGNHAIINSPATARRTWAASHGGWPKTITGPSRT